MSVLQSSLDDDGWDVFSPSKIYLKLPRVLRQTQVRCNERPGAIGLTKAADVAQRNLEYGTVGVFDADAARVYMESYHSDVPRLVGVGHVGFNRECKYVLNVGISGFCQRCGSGSGTGPTNRRPRL